jgi:hypothetical protein
MRSTTTVALTTRGRVALAGYTEALHNLLGGAEFSLVALRQAVVSWRKRTA